MAVKQIGTSREFIIHPGEMIADLITERGITQSELARRMGVSEAYISSVLSGKKSISANLAMLLEYALGVSKTFWLNLQANYDAEILAADEMDTVTEAEVALCPVLRSIIKDLRNRGLIPVAQKAEETVISLRKALKVGNLCNLKDIVPAGAFRMAGKAPINEYVMGAWLQLNLSDKSTMRLNEGFNVEKVDSLVSSLKRIMLNRELNPQEELPKVLALYGIGFRVVRDFKGAPVHGFISKRKDGTYQMILTIRGAYADIFWFSLFHELGHIINGDVNRTGYYMDIAESEENDHEAKANIFAADALLEAQAYQRFVQQGYFNRTTITTFASEQHVPPYIVIGRLQKEGRIPYHWFSDLKLRYKWSHQ